MTFRSRFPVILLTALLALTLVGATSADTARSVHPGVQMRTEGGQCTANFVFTDGDDLFLGQAAHCAAVGATSGVNGCETESLPMGTEVQIEGATQPGTLAYSSWATMRDVGEERLNPCQFNDFSLVRVAEADERRVSPTLPIGGPKGINTQGTTAGETIYTYGASELRQGIEELSPKTGTSLGTVGNGWSHAVITPVTPGLPGDSGSAVLDSEGRALGVLVTLEILPRPGANGVTDLSHALAYANRFADASNSEVGGSRIRLVNGTRPLEPTGLVGLVGSLLPL